MSASDLISFIIKYIGDSRDILEGDYIHIKNNVKNIKNAHDVNEWLKYIKKLLGYRKYNLLKTDFEDSRLVDIGFSRDPPSLEMDRFKYIHSL